MRISRTKRRLAVTALLSLACVTCNETPSRTDGAGGLDGQQLSDGALRDGAPQDGPATDGLAPGGDGAQPGNDGATPLTDGPRRDGPRRDGAPKSDGPRRDGAPKADGPRRDSAPKSDGPVPPPPVAGEWTQHAHDAQRTSFTSQEVAAPWRWKWSWNGPNASGGISSGKTGLPRNVQPVTGAGRVYVARGADGITALSEATGAELWSAKPGGSILSTPAYDGGSLYVASDNGTLYRLNASSGQVTGQYAAGAALATPPALAGGRVFVSSGNKVHAVDAATMAVVWTYDAGSPVQTPPAYSPSKNRVVVATADLYVHAIANGSTPVATRAWRVKPTTRAPGSPVEYLWGWPVVAEGHGLVLIKLRLDWDTMWTWNPWPTTNAQIRTNLQGNPGQQALFALKLDDGSSPFICNVGHGGYGDGGYMPMGPQPVVKRFGDGSEVVYTVGRGSSTTDARWDSVFVELLLDSTTVAGYGGGEVRFIQYNHNVLTDEQPNPVVSGSQLLGGHWMAGYALELTDRSAARGAFGNRIASRDLPHITTSASNCGYSTGHYCAGGLIQDSDPRAYPAGFYIYYKAGQVYDAYNGDYATWVVSNSTVYFRSCDGAIVALQAGTPLVGPPPPGPVGVDSVPGGRIPNPGAKPRPARGPAVIPFTEAREHPGELKIVEGTVRYIFNNGKAVYFGFAYPHQGVFKAKVRRAAWPRFPGGPERLVRLGSRVRVHGRIAWYQGDPVIYLEGPRDLTVVRR
ncbi:MAG: PQQ-binding-like beta-propeller repeat protein [Deltaproteobacteria bacterium]|nr:PQQ-binding-like beta-propeller repeat protein [Deltaproteobacteria bacterium]